MRSIRLGRDGPLPCSSLRGFIRPSPDRSGNKAAKFKAIAAGPQERLDRVIIATDCDREGQLIGQEILEHLQLRGEVLRAMFTAQDPTTLRQAFYKLKPNREPRPLYAAAVARQQADQIFNLSLTRAATKALVPAGVRGVIGIGRVKTPTLAIVCRRELEIRDFKPEDYFEVVATATVRVARSSSVTRPAGPARIKDRAAAEAIANAAAEGFSGPLSGQGGSAVRHRHACSTCRRCRRPAASAGAGRQRRPSPSLRSSMMARARSSSPIRAPRPAIWPRTRSATCRRSLPPCCACVASRSSISTDPVIRRGKCGHFYDKGLEGVSHHAVVPNVNVVADIEVRIARLSDDEKRLFALVCRSYLAAVMPDYEYRQTATC